MLRRILASLLILMGNAQLLAAHQPGRPSEGDTLYVLIRIKGMELVSGDWNHGDYLQHQLVAALKKDFRKRPAEFIFQTDNAQPIPGQSNYILDLTILELHVNEPVINQQNRSVSRDVTTNTYSDEAEDVRKQHTTVYADMVVYEKSVNAIVRIAVSATRLPELQSGWNEVLAESYKWENKSATYTGNFQAMGSKDIELVRSKARPVPSSDQVYKDMIREIFVKNSRKIVNNLH